MREAVALVGDPVAQSPSPAMHRAAFAALGLDLHYRAVLVRLDELTEASPSLAGRFVGLNVTRPLKEAILPLLDEVAPEAARAGSVNTVSFRAGRAVGISTDGPGFLAALRGTGLPVPARSVILGSGGAARAVASALLEVGTAVSIWARNPQTGRRLAADLDGPTLLSRDRLARAVRGADLLVNATPVGGWPGPADDPLPQDVTLHPGTTVFDLVYRPRRTALLERADRAGCPTVEGVEMLVEQGAESIRAWTGREPPVEVMRSAALRALAAEPTPAGRDR